MPFRGAIYATNSKGYSRNSRTKGSWE
jgi:hypothetical protein